MKKLAGRDFEDILQCAIPAFEGLLDPPHDSRLMRLLFCTAEWHAFAKLRIHTDMSLKRLDDLTKEFGKLMREFHRLSCSEFNTVELPGEVNKRNRQAAKKKSRSGGKNKAPGGQQQKELNLSTYKYHALGDYTHSIRLFGGTDSFSTQLVCPSLRGSAS